MKLGFAEDENKKKDTFLIKIFFPDGKTFLIRRFFFVLLTDIFQTFFDDH